MDTASKGKRVDWATFFTVVRQPHGVRVRLGVGAASPLGLRAEKRLLRLVRARVKTGVFALRRTIGEGPTSIECLFDSSTLADDFALAIGATSRKPPVGWTTARELVADGVVLTRLLNLGAAPLSENVDRERAIAETPRGQSPLISPIATVMPPANQVGPAVSRLRSMTLEEQAVALFSSMMNAR